MHKDEVVVCCQGPAPAYHAPKATTVAMPPQSHKLAVLVMLLLLAALSALYVPQVIGILQNLFNSCVLKKQT